MASTVDIIRRNQAEAERLQAETDKIIRQADAENRAETEKMFFANLAFRESGKMMGRSIDHFVGFVETREGRETNALAAQLKADLPHPDVEVSWNAGANGLNDETERDRHRADVIGDFFEGEVPDGTQAALDLTRERLDATRNLLHPNSAPEGHGEETAESVVREILAKDS